MAKPPSQRKKATSAASTDSEAPASSTENISNQEDPASATRGEMSNRTESYAKAETVTTVGGTIRLPFLRAYASN